MEQGARSENEKREAGSGNQSHNSSIPQYGLAS